MCCCLFASFAGNYPPKRYKLTLVLTDSITQNPLEAASITIANRYVISDQTGMAVVDSLPKGFYTVQCVYVGYHNLQMRIWLEADQTLAFALCPTSQHLHEVEVTGHADEMLQFAVQSRSFLSATQIEQTRGLTLSDQLKLLSGVTMLSSGPIITKPVIRGLHSNRLVTINNGIRQEGQQWGADHGMEIDPFTPAGIEVIKGAASVEYGAEAMGGVVKVSPREFKNSPGVNGELQLQGASNNGMGATSLLLEGSHFEKHKLSWRTQGSYRKAGDSRTPNYVLSNTGFDELSGSLAIHYAHKHFHAEIFQSYFGSTMGILRSAHIGNQTDLLAAVRSSRPFYVAPFTYAIDNPKQEVVHQITALKVYYGLPNNMKIHLQASRQQNDRREFDRAPRSSQRQLYNNVPAYELLLITDIVETKFEHKLQPKITGQIGASYMNQGNVTDGLQPIIPNFRAYTYGVFAIEKWQSGRWMAEAGMRYDYRRQTRFTNVNNEIQADEKHYSSTTFSVGGSYLISSLLKLNSNISSAWRPPSINELYSYGLHGGTATFEIGNANLNPERSYNGDIGLVFNHTKWTGEASIFRNQFDGFIYKVPNPVPTLTIRGSFPMLNFVQTNALLQGAEVTIQRSILQSFSLAINGSYLYAQNITDNVPLIFMPANRTRLIVKYEKNEWRKLKNVFANLQYAVVAQQNRFPQGLDLINPPPAYGLVDVNMGVETRLGKQPIRLSASIYNLFNTSYRDYLSRFRYYTNEPGVNLMIRLAVPFIIYK